MRKEIRDGEEEGSAAVAAEYYSAWRIAEHRGVEEYGHRIVVFGNDGRPDSPDRPEAAEEVRLVREAVRREGLEEDDFATTGSSWVLVVRSRAPEEQPEVTAAMLHRILLQAAVRAWGGLTGRSCSLTLHSGRGRPSPAEVEEMRRPEVEAEVRRRWQACSGEIEAEVSATLGEWADAEQTDGDEGTVYYPSYAQDITEHAGEVAERLLVRDDDAEDLREALERSIPDRKWSWPSIGIASFVAA